MFILLTHPVNEDASSNPEFFRCTQQCQNNMKLLQLNFKFGVSFFIPVYGGSVVAWLSHCCRYAHYVFFFVLEKSKIQDGPAEKKSKKSVSILSLINQSSLYLFPYFNLASHAGFHSDWARPVGMFGLCAIYQVTGDVTVKSDVTPIGDNGII